MECGMRELIELAKDDPEYGKRIAFLTVEELRREIERVASASRNVQETKE